MKNKKIISTIIVVLILIIITAIWAIKNNEKKDTQNIGENEKSEMTNSDFLLNVNSELDIEKLKSYNIPIIIDFGADSCIPCKEMEPVLKSLNNELYEKAIIKFVDVWKNQKLAIGYPVTMIPTQLFIDSNGLPYIPKEIKDIKFEIHKDSDGNHIFTTHVGGLTKTQMLRILKEMGLNE